MIIECNHCDAKVNAKVLGKKEFKEYETGHPIEYLLGECPVCGSVLLGRSKFEQVGPEDYDMGPAERLWPVPPEKDTFDSSIPSLVRKSLHEARLCYRAKAYSACAVMCGRAIEAICKEHKTKSRNLAGGLRELKTKGVIDGRLFDWGEALRGRRNIGAHATEEDISREDAHDILDFGVAICEYVFVLSERYEEFIARERRKKAKRSLRGASVSFEGKQTDNKGP